VELRKKVFYLPKRVFLTFRVWGSQLFDDNFWFRWVWTLKVVAIDFSSLGAFFELFSMNFQQEFPNKILFFLWVMRYPHLVHRVQRHIPMLRLVLGTEPQKKCWNPPPPPPHTPTPPKKTRKKFLEPPTRKKKKKRYPQHFRNPQKRDFLTFRNPQLHVGFGSPTSTRSDRNTDPGAPRTQTHQGITPTDTPTVTPYTRPAQWSIVADKLSMRPAIFLFRSGPVLLQD